MLIVKSIIELVKQTLSSKDNILIKLNLGNVTQQHAELIFSKTGININGYKLIIDNYAIKHTLLSHGSISKESKRGQIAVTIDDFKLIPEVINSPDNIIDGGLNKIGRRVIILEKIINNKVVYIEEIRTKHKELAMQTMYIKKAPKK
jgi:hypothetical protein